MKQTRFQIAKKDINKFFKEYNAKIFSYKDISKILDSNRRYWRLSVNLTAQEFIDLLVTHTNLKKYEVNFPRETITRFAWDNISAFSLASNLEKNSYLTHYTALFLHNLTTQIPKMIYVNYEQAEKYNKNAMLTQERIDRAFLNRPRISNNIARYKDYKICLLNGKFTNRTGVTEITILGNEKLFITDIERTLIDITVRPSYSGGVHEVLRAYQKAVGKVSINKLAAMLKKLNYIYPYHQAIGFYLQKAGVYKESQVQLLKNFDFKFDFYISHQMKEKEYSKEWRLYYPKGF
jgi:predicted transcriptional regulator of viral defense system